MYLLDTNIISLVSPGRKLGAPDMEIVEWLRRISDRLHLSVVTTAEIESGISQLIRMGGTRKASALASWLDNLVDLYAARIHAMDIETARIAGRLYDRAVANGHKSVFEDAAIAATAQARNLTVITRNAAHFSHFAIPFLNPYDGIPANE